MIIPNTKNIRLYGAIIIFLAGIAPFILTGTADADDTGDPYSVQKESTERAWYDETWEALAFYRSTKTFEAAGDKVEFKYIWTEDPSTNINPTYSIPPSQEGTSIIPGTQMPSDMTATEWKVTGHVHFESGL